MIIYTKWAAKIYLNQIYLFETMDDFIIHLYESLVLSLNSHNQHVRAYRGPQFAKKNINLASEPNFKDVLKTKLHDVSINGLGQRDTGNCSSQNFRRITAKQVYEYIDDFVNRFPQYRNLPSIFNYA